MINLLGTSHISPESLKQIREAINKKPDCVAVELDQLRFKALKEKETKTKFSFNFLSFLAYIQEYLGKRTGMMPGYEMLEAVNLAEANNIDLILIDLSITETIAEFKKVSILEKLKLLILSLFQLIFFKFDLKKLPPYSVVEKALKQLAKYTPEIYKILITKRELYMFNKIIALREIYDDILVVVGLGHIKGLTKLLKNKGFDIKVLGNIDK